MNTMKYKVKYNILVRTDDRVETRAVTDMLQNKNMLSLYLHRLALTTISGGTVIIVTNMRTNQETTISVGYVRQRLDINVHDIGGQSYVENI